MEMGLGRSLTAIVMMILETSNSILVIFLPARWSRRSQKCGASKDERAQKDWLDER